ncbi:MAG: response regulator [Armatimonadetes bacterium]|nr:response regulator [Armatimonadota bacterium]
MDIRILIVENETVQLAVLADCVRSLGYTPVVATGLREALSLLCGPPPELVLLDLVLGDGKGRDLYLAIRKDPEWSEVPVILTTGLPEREMHEQARGVQAPMLRKPFGLADLKRAVAMNLPI